MKNKLSKPKKTTKDKEAEFVTMTVKIQGIAPLLVHNFQPGRRYSNGLAGDCHK